MTGKKRVMFPLTFRQGGARDERKNRLPELGQMVHVEWPAPLDAALIMVEEGRGGAEPGGGCLHSKVLAADSESSEARKKKKERGKLAMLGK